MTPYYDDGNGMVIYHGDALEVVPTLNLSQDETAVVSDPPYGMRNNGDTTRFTGGMERLKAQKMGRSCGVKRGRIHGDELPFDPAPWLGFKEVILWGCNHYGKSLPVGTTLVWIKKYDRLFGTFLSDAELSWQKGGCGVYCFKRNWSGFDRLLTSGKSKHQNEKPVELMTWCVSRTTLPTILDPFMGSGTTLVAAKQLGRHGVGIEIEEKYCEVAAKRLQQSVMIFEDATPGLTQSAIHYEDEQ